MWRKPDLSDESLGPTWGEVRALLSSPERRRRLLRWGAVSLAVAVAASAIALVLLPGGPGVNSWPFVAARCARRHHHHPVAGTADAGDALPVRDGTRHLPLDCREAPSPSLGQAGRPARPVQALTPRRSCSVARPVGQQIDGGAEALLAAARQLPDRPDCSMTSASRLRASLTTNVVILR